MDTLLPIIAIAGIGVLMIWMVRRGEAG